MNCLFELLDRFHEALVKVCFHTLKIILLQDWESISSVREETILS